MAYHEELIHEDVRFPIIFHTDTVVPSTAAAGAHWHRSLEVLCTLSGNGYTLVDGERITMTAGEIVVIPSSSIHITHTDMGSCRYHCLIIDQDFLSDKGIWMEYDRLPLQLRDPQVSHLMRQIEWEMTTQPPCYKEMVISLVVQIVIGLRRRHPLVNRNPSPLAEGGRIETVRKVIAAIDREFDRPISLDYLCQIAGMSKYYFCRAFKQATGQTVTQYINWVRCNQARRLLASGQSNVGEAAERCGFHNLSYFTKVYRRQYGRAPSQEKRSGEVKSGLESQDTPPMQQE